MKHQWTNPLFLPGVELSKRQSADVVHSLSRSPLPVRTWLLWRDADILAYLRASSSVFLFVLIFMGTLLHFLQSFNPTAARITGSRWHVTDHTMKFEKWWSYCDKSESNIDWENRRQSIRKNDWSSVWHPRKNSIARRTEEEEDRETRSAISSQMPRNACVRFLERRSVRFST